MRDVAVYIHMAGWACEMLIFHRAFEMKIFDLICARWECEMGMRDVMCICVYRSMSMCAYMYIDCGMFYHMYMRDRSVPFFQGNNFYKVPPPHCAQNHSSKQSRADHCAQKHSSNKSRADAT